MIYREKGAEEQKRAEKPTIDNEMPDNLVLCEIYQYHPPPPSYI